MSTQLITTKIKTYAGTGNGINGNHASVAYYNALTEGSHNNSIDNLLNGVKWGNALGQGASLLLSISNSHSTYNGGLGNLKNFSTTQIDAIHNAMQAWQNIANITFTEITDSATNAGDIRWANSNSSTANTGYTYYPSASSNGSAGDIYMGVNVPTPTIGAWAYLTYMHELAHALGFLHPHDSSAHVPAKTGEDQVKYTVMSYKDYAGDSSGYNASYYPTTPMLNDISAMQFLYGANTHYHSGDDIYNWSANQKVFETIWDAGGNDTIDASNQILGVLLNLNSGQWSQIGVAFSNSKIMVRDCLTIAYGAVIENAIGSAVADTLIGNTTTNSLTGGAGNDTVQGNIGNDTLNGGDGNDEYVFNLGDGADIISDNSGNDTILFGAGINSTQITASLNGTQIKLTINAQDSIQLSDLLAIEHFSFADGTLLNTNWLSGLVNISSNNHNPALTGTVINLVNGTEDANYNFTASQLLSGWTDADNNTLTLSNISVNHGTLITNNNNYVLDIIL